MARLLLCCALLLAGFAAHADDFTFRLGPHLRAAGFNELHEAAWQGNIGELRRRLKTMDVNVRSNSGITPLHSAATANRMEAAKLLIAAGADLEAREQFGRTPLFVTAEINSRPTEMLELLIQVGADIQAKDKFGKTPLQAAWKDAARETLLKHGAKP